MNEKQLFDLIQSHVAAKLAWDSNDDAGVATALNDKTIERTDDTPRDSNWLTNHLTESEADTVLGTLQASTIPRVKAAVAKLAGNGIDLSNPQVQSMIPQLGAADNWGQELIDKVLTAGIWTESPAENTFGRGTVVTTADVAEARAWKDLLERLAANYNAAVTGIQDGSLTTWEDVEGVVTA